MVDTDFSTVHHELMLNDTKMPFLLKVHIKGSNHDDRFNEKFTR